MRCFRQGILGVIGTLLFFTAISSATESAAWTVSQGPLLGMEFVSIPSGSFQMGSPSSEDGRFDDESRHSVYVGSFELMTTEVTQGMWEEVLGTTVDEMRSRSEYDYGLTGFGSDYPMYYVSWDDCQDFINELNDMDPNHTYRLPSEAEWEYACRAGTTECFYWGSSMNGSYYWYYGNSGSNTHPVAAKHPNTWGLYDMSGNVWEWCADLYTSDYDNCPTDGSAYKGSGSNRVLRGGSWSYYARDCRSAHRSNGSPGGSSYFLGFRLARSVL